MMIVRVANMGQPRYIIPFMAVVFKDSRQFEMEKIVNRLLLMRNYARGLMIFDICK